MTQLRKAVLTECLPWMRRCCVGLDTGTILIVDGDGRSELAGSTRQQHGGARAVNGKTAIDGAATFGSGFAVLDRAAVGVVALGCHIQTRIGRSIFLMLMSPPSWKRTSMRLPTLSLTIDDTQIPPGSASGSKRAAILTPSP